MDTGLIENRLEEAERLLLAPTAANLELLAEQMTEWMGPVLAALSGPALPERLRARVGGLRELLEAAWQIRLGLARAAAAGLAGYSSAGSSENRPESKAQTRLTATA
jgi:hypothetical protein